MRVAIGDAYRIFNERKQSNAHQPALAFRNGLREALKGLTSALVAICAEEIDGADEPPLRDELATAIGNHISAFIQSCAAGVHGTAVKSASREVARLLTTCTMGIDGALELAVHERKKRQRQEASVKREVNDTSPQGIPPVKDKATMTAPLDSHKDLPRLFIGSTVEALDVARAVQAELHHELDVEIWNQGLFQPGMPTWTSLIEGARAFDFALFVFSGDDVVTARDATSAAVRDNLLIEFGLYAGLLGSERTLFLFNHDRRPKIATDLGGITPLTYRDQRIPNLQASVGPACTRLRQVVTKLGRRQNP